MSDANGAELSPEDKQDASELVGYEMVLTLLSTPRDELNEVSIDLIGDLVPLIYFAPESGAAALRAALLMLADLVLQFREPFTDEEVVRARENIMLGLVDRQLSTNLESEEDEQ
jgi:hypothetical protein